MSLVRRSLRLALAILGAVLVRVLARLSPQRWCPPAISLRLFRLTSEPASTITAADLRSRLPEGGRRTRTDLEYAPGSGRHGRFDLVLPDGPGPHPLVVWLHGGGWHFGDKADVLPYLEHLATRGFAGAAVNYPLAPESRYPAAPRQVNEAVRHLLAHADEYGIDPSRVVLAGDSAGAQVAAELAVLTTSPGYAARTDLAPALAPEQLRGALLFCGIFDPTGLDDSSRMFEAVLESAMWSLTGTRRWKDSEVCERMSVRTHATAAFPPTFLSAGNQDPLTRRQTPPMALRLGELGVALDEYYPGDEAAPINHEFQFWLGTPEGAEAFERAVAFLERVAG
ncbi:alpha/beta hydrolase [Nocardioides marmoriginsengisoli]|uniref:Alpha/beta hydrolase n=1 Tax=Nocardioides marmoriginsengisoli TaxID=661483 RepID=A0A3N0CLK3_9ACTN|nr:alpha/beta hydrolase [Nocardioides marmoriginsengisoli]RNL64322.1 alpha/beta hydrolase [Nocardioides marmoriginsengisoli]